MMSFQDNFWGEENRGFGVLLKRLKYGRRTTESLLNFLATRIEIEEEYVKKLGKLGTFQFPREEMFYGGGKGRDLDLTNILPHELASAIFALPVQTAELVSRHGTLIESLKQRLLWPLEHSLKEQSVVKKQHKQEMIRIVKNKISQQETVNRLKDRYYTRCKEKAILVDGNVSGLTGKYLERHEQKLKKAKEAEQEADAEYRSATYKLNELHSQWQSRMVISCQEFQKLDETRMELTKNVLYEYSIISQCHMQEQAVAYEHLRDRAMLCDRQIELQEFIHRHGTGTNVPMSPIYTNFSNESIEESLRRLSVRATQSPRKLYSSESFETEPFDHFSSRYNNSQRVPSVCYSAVKANSELESRKPSVVLSMLTPPELMDGHARGSVTSFNSNLSMSGHRPSIVSARSGSARPSIAPSARPSIASSTRSNYLFRVRALYSYEPQGPEEISLKVNQILNVLSIADDPWWYGQIDGSPHLKEFSFFQFSIGPCLFPKHRLIGSPHADVGKERTIPIYGKFCDGMTVDVSEEVVLLQRQRSEELGLIKSREKKRLFATFSNNNNGKVADCRRRLVGSYEECLFRGCPIGPMTKFTLELSIFRSDSRGTFKRMFPLNAAPCDLQSAMSPWIANCSLGQQVNVSPLSTIQMILRSVDGIAGKVFLLRLDLSDMPPASKTIIRQKHYYRNSLDEHEYVQQGVQIHASRSLDKSRAETTLDGNGNVRIHPSKPRHSISLHGDIRLAFTFNQAATIGGSSTRDTNIMTERLRIVTEFPLEKYFLLQDKRLDRMSSKGEILH